MASLVENAASASGATARDGEPRRVCIAGGGFARRYANAFHEAAATRVVGVCTRRAETATELAAAAGGTAYTDFARMLSVEEPDIVVVGTPNHLHHPMAMGALEAGAEVICEKPLALDAVLAEEMAAFAASLGRRTRTSFTWRFLPTCVALKQLLESGRLGELYQVDLRYRTRGFGEVHGPMRWQFDRSTAGSGALANLGSHAVDLLHWWFGDLRRAAAVTRTVIPSRATPSGGTAPVSVEDLASATLELADGTPVGLSVGWVAHVARVGLEVEIHGSDASAWLRFATGEAPAGRLSVSDESTTAPVEVELADARAGDWADLGQACVSRLVAAFLEPDGITSGSPDFVDGLRAQCVVDAILEAAEHRAWVEVTYPALAAGLAGPRPGERTGAA